MPLTNDLAPEADEFWTAIVEHPMVEALGAGTFDEATDWKTDAATNRGAGAW